MDAQTLWKHYIQLTDAEWAFRITKDELVLRPIWHQKEDRVLAHILVCFLAYVLWKTLAATVVQALQPGAWSLDPSPLTVQSGPTQSKSGSSQK